MDLLQYLQIKTKESSKDQVVLTMDISDFHKQPHGIVHGGVNGVLIETACSIGANEQLSETEAYAVGVDLQINHLKSAASGTLSVIAQPNHVGHSIQVWEAKIFNDANELTSVGRCTLMRREIKSS
ncbi:PaaI family thioesterase [Enterococcus sp. UD-01]|jgi:1,4-dihydroxy-2-naphthoyl-CoA hydrolase|uniref:PaaI family thioesterase n=1 Tax=Enterococcus sp. UD-01 TaxID=3373911 RepID=UPI0038333142